MSLAFEESRQSDKSGLIISVVIHSVVLLALLVALPTGGGKPVGDDSISVEFIGDPPKGENGTDQSPIDETSLGSQNINPTSSKIDAVKPPPTPEPVATMPPPTPPAPPPPPAKPVEAMSPPIPEKQVVSEKEDAEVIEKAMPIPPAVVRNDPPKPPSVPMPVTKPKPPIPVIKLKSPAPVSSQAQKDDLNKKTKQILASIAAEIPPNPKNDISKSTFDQSQIAKTIGSSSDPGQHQARLGLTNATGTLPVHGAKDGTGGTGTGSGTQAGNGNEGVDWGAFDRLMVDHFHECWQKEGVEFAGSYKPEFEAVLSREGRVIGTPKIINPPHNEQERALMESGLRAMKNCGPMQIQAIYTAHYDEWRTGTFKLEPAY